MTGPQASDWLAEEFAEAERRQAELPVWARPVYVPPADAPACPVCRDTGSVWSPDPDGESVYESACPERIHDGQAVTFPVDSTPSTPLTDWDW